jgi:hypothetical protein
MESTRKGEKTEKDVRLPLSGERLQRWDEMLAARKIAQQDALHGMIDWVVEQDEMVQLMVMGRIPPAKDLIELILNRIRRDAANVRMRSDRRGGTKPAAGGGD